jgi:RNA polymerase sigma-70 factor (ECF subfamily)
MEYSATRTSTSLLARVGLSVVDQSAWVEFVRRYGPTVRHWCREWSLQEADADDVTQTVLAKLAARLRDFCYNPARSFRGYLKTITRYACLDFLGARNPDVGAGGSTALDLLHQTAVSTDDGLGKSFDDELLGRAAERVRRRVAPHTWEAFRLTTADALSGAAAAERLGLKVATVFKAKSKVQQMLREEVDKLRPD